LLKATTAEHPEDLLSASEQNMRMLHRCTITEAVEKHGFFTSSPD
jgi:hypothetical protein